MRILAIDTSNDVCSVAINEDGSILDEMHSFRRKRAFTNTYAYDKRNP